MLVDLNQVASALPGYVLGEQLGKGAFGIVLAATDRLGRDVAVKALPLSGDEAEAEARILHRLRHPHIVEVLDYVPAHDLALIVMERLSPKNLRARLRAGRLRTEEACAVALAVATALDFAHRQKLLHRDVKPENVLFTATGRPKLTDFGIAKAITSGTSTFVHTVIGTPLYMAPEQFLADRLGPTVDVYALGAITYELLAGRPPSGTLPRTYEALRGFHLDVPPAPIPQIPTELEAVVLRALTKSAGQRTPTAQAFALELATAARVLGLGWLDRAGVDVALDPEVSAVLAAPTATQPRPRTGLPPLPAPASRPAGLTTAPPPTPRPTGLTPLPAPAPRPAGLTPAPTSAPRPTGPLPPPAPRPAPAWNPAPAPRPGPAVSEPPRPSSAPPAPEPAAARQAVPAGPPPPASGPGHVLMRPQELPPAAPGIEAKLRSPWQTAPAPEPAQRPADVQVPGGQPERTDLAFNPSQDEEYPRAGRRAGLLTIALTLTVLTVLAVLAVLLH